MAVYECQGCGLASSYAGERPDEVQDPVTGEVRDGLFITCLKCDSTDVDVYSDDGWQIEVRAREVAERGPL